MDSSIKNFSMDAFSLKGKVAIVTGANFGLGMAYAYAFAKAGADLFIPHFVPDISEIREIIESAGRRVEFLQGDLTKKEYVEQVVEECLKCYGKIDILVNNAGASFFADFLDYPDSEWQRVIDLDLNSVYYLSHRVAKQMVVQKSGKIINIGSALSFTADKKCPPYTASKHAILGLTKVFANELGEYNVQTNAICPGFLATDVNKELRADKAFYDKITNRIPIGRWGAMSDLMGAAVFLASSASDYINGTFINIDGGFATTL
jgi:2-deoxy-D-gluconate 3-dehydrogenase